MGLNSNVEPHFSYCINVFFLLYFLCSVKCSGVVRAEKKLPNLAFSPNNDSVQFDIQSARLAQVFRSFPNKYSIVGGVRD